MPAFLICETIWNSFTAGAPFALWRQYSFWICILQYLYRACVQESLPGPSLTLSRRKNIPHPHPQLLLQAVGSPVTAPGFAVHLNKYVRSLPFFNTPPAASWKHPFWNEASRNFLFQSPQHGVKSFGNLASNVAELKCDKWSFHRERWCARQPAGFWRFAQRILRNIVNQQIES